MNVLSSCPHSPPVLLIHNFVGEVEEAERAQDEQEPEGAVLSEVHVAIVVHGIVGACTLVIHDV